MRKQVDLQNETKKTQRSAKWEKKGYNHLSDKMKKVECVYFKTLHYTESIF